MELDSCIPADKHDHAAVARAVDAGYPALNLALPELLEWVQDINWPVAPDLVALLAQAGPEIAPHVKMILNSEDTGWKYSVLAFLAEHLRWEVWVLIEPDIARIARRPTAREKADEVNRVARELLVLRPRKDK